MLHVLGLTLASRAALHPVDATRLCSGWSSPGFLQIHHCILSLLPSAGSCSSLLLLGLFATSFTILLSPVSVGQHQSLWPSHNSASLQLSLLGTATKLSALTFPAAYHLAPLRTILKYQSCATPLATPQRTLFHDINEGSICVGNQQPAYQCALGEFTKVKPQSCARAAKTALRRLPTPRE